MYHLKRLIDVSSDPSRLLTVLLVVIMILSIQSETSAQISSIEDQLESELLKRGISQEEFEELLLDAGYDPDRLDQLTSDQVRDLEKLLQDFERDRFFRQRNLLLSDTSGLRSEDDGAIDLDTTSLVFDSLSTDIDTIEEAIYGHKRFKTGQITLISDDQGYRPPETYVLGVGDELAVSIFGYSRVEDTHVIRSDGAITILRGNVKVTMAGLSVEEARLRLERAYRNEYRFSANQFSLYVSAVRKIRVEVYGEVIKNGTYTISASNGITNLIAAAGGFTDNGSVRNIQLVKGSGDILNFDLYKILTEPEYRLNFSLDDGDYIIVPAAQIIASIDGAVNRPLNYELKPDEGLFELIEYAGGLSKGAFLTSMKVVRYEGDKRVIKDVAYANLVKSGQDFPLAHGDEVMVTRIEEELENFVTVRGEVRNEGNFELIPDMSLKEVIGYAGIKSTTKTDFAQLKRVNENGSVNLIAVSLEDALNGIGPSSLIVMQDRDELIVWPKERFLDNKYIKVAGAVRVPEQFDYDEGGTMRALDLINLAGGLRSDAAGFAHLNRLDPLNPNSREYIKIDLARLLDDANAIDNLYLEPFDSLYVFSDNEFQDNLYIKVSGAVNNPGKFIYGTDMTIKDAVILAGGFKRSSATNRVELSRVIIEDNQSTQTTVQKLSLSRSMRSTGGDDNFRLEPFDNVFVRYVPQFELQQNVFLHGEVTFPGEYSLEKDNETIYDVIQKAGGLTKEAFPAAAKLFRSQDSIGLMVLRLDEVMDDPTSRYNQALAGGDTITIPKRFNHVIISGATQYLTENSVKQIVVPYEPNKDALFYINNHAGGFADNARKDKILVQYPNGEVKNVKKRFLLGPKYPKVLPGSEIKVWTVKRDLRSEREEEQVNWTKVLGDSVAQAMSILTLILLVQRLD